MFTRFRGQSRGERPTEALQNSSNYPIDVAQEEGTEGSRYRNALEFHVKFKSIVDCTEPLMPFYATTPPPLKVLSK